MHKVWKVFLNEYTRHVFRKRFIFAVLSIPLLIGVVLGISIFASVLQMDRSPVGYVDTSGLLAEPASLPPADDPFSEDVAYIAFPSQSLAQAALEAGEIQGYYILPSDYIETGRAELIYYEEPHEQIQKRFRDLVRFTLLKSQSGPVAHRLTQGSTMIIQSMDGTREMVESDWFNIMIPLLVGVIFMIVVMTSGGYLLQAVVEEKENRTMEIIITSISPTQLMAGKILGNISVGLTQLLLWILFILLGVLVGRDTFDWIDRIQFGWDYLALMLAALLPAFVMVAALMATIGATVTESREAQQISGLFSIPIMIPYWFTFQIMTNPNGPLALGLSFFPLTAPVALSMRAGFTQIPPAQLALNLSLLVVFAIGAVWVAARAFRLGMLSYGKRINLRQIFSRPQ